MELCLIGIGTGNPDHITAQAVAALNAADLILIPRKGPDKSDLAEIRHLILSRVLARPVPVADFDMPQRGTSGGYASDVADWHDAIQTAVAVLSTSFRGRQNSCKYHWQRRAPLQ